MIHPVFRIVGIACSCTSATLGLAFMMCSIMIPLGSGDLFLLISVIISMITCGVMVALSFKGCSCISVGGCRSWCRIFPSSAGHSVGDLLGYLML